MYTVLNSTSRNEHGSENATTPVDQLEKFVMVEGQEVEVKVADARPQPRRGPKVTFRMIGPDSHGRKGKGPPVYAKIFLPKTHEDARIAAISCFGNILERPKYFGERPGGGEYMDFALKARIKASDVEGWAWAHIQPSEWWEIMNELIEENPDLEVGIFPCKD